MFKALPVLLLICNLNIQLKDEYDDDLGMRIIILKKCDNVSLTRNETIDAYEVF